MDEEREDQCERAQNPRATATSKEREVRLQHLQQCVPVSTPDQMTGLSLATVRKMRQRARVAAL